MRAVSGPPAGIVDSDFEYVVSFIKIDNNNSEIV